MENKFLNKNVKPIKTIVALLLLFLCSITYAQTEIATIEKIEKDIEVFIKKNKATYKIDLHKYSSNLHSCVTKPFSKQQSNEEKEYLIAYELRKKYFEENPLALKAYTKVADPKTLLQNCADGNFESWPATNPFVFKSAINPSNGQAQNIITTGTDFVPFTVGTGVNLFNNSATLVSPGNDPQLGSLVQRVFSGNRAIKLNLANTSDFRVVTMSRTMIVNESNFDFNYSLILNDPGGNSHNLLQKPFFLVRLYDQNDNIIRQVNMLTNPGDCQLTSTTIPGFNGNILYSGWRCARINTNALIGQTVRVEFIVADCSFGGHFGTVYIDEICNSNCANPLFGSIDLNPIQTMQCPTTNQTICGTFQTPLNSYLNPVNGIQLNILQNGNIVTTINNPSSLTSNTFCFVVSPSAFGSNPTGEFEFQVVGNFIRDCVIDFQLDPIFDNSANDTGPDVSFATTRIPTFNQPNSICEGSIVNYPILPTTSLNGITGTWSPALNNIATTTYTFTPDSGQCALPTTMTITVMPLITPLFNQVSPICPGDILNPLPTTSLNGISGTWSPALNNMVTTTYTFIPNNGQCAVGNTMTIVVKRKTKPLFMMLEPICKGGNITLPTTSENGVTGTWSPAINNQVTTTYTFTPNTVPGSCYSTSSMTVVVKSVEAINDDFTTTPINVLTGGASPSVLTNDFANGVQANNSNVTTSIMSVTPAMAIPPTIDNNGSITVEMGVTPGTYDVQYKIVLNECPNTFAIATAKILVKEFDIITPPISPGIRANNIVHQIDVQSNGKIIIGGYFTAYNNVNRRYIARLNTNLTLDTSSPLFVATGSTNGNFTPFDLRVIKNAGTNYNKILLVGWFEGFNGGTNGYGIARLNTNGSIDTSFNTGQLATPTSVRGANGRLYSCFVIPDGLPNAGKILIGGMFDKYNGYPANKIALLNSNGTFDTTSTFNTNLNTIINPTNAVRGLNSAPTVFAVQQDGKIIVGGFFSKFNGVIKNRILRLETTGLLDNTFNQSYSGSAPEFIDSHSVSTIIIQNDGKIVVGGGFSKYNGAPRSCIARLNANGSLDTTFNVGSGFNITGANTTGTQATVRSFAYDASTASLFVGGDLTSYKGVPVNNLVKIKLNDASIVPLSNFPNGAVWKLYRQSDGKIIVGGRFTQFGISSALNITRISSGGVEARTPFATPEIWVSEPEIDIFTTTQTDEILIYPNPTKGEVQIILPKDILLDTPIELYNTMGQKIKEIKMNDYFQTIDLSNLSKGTYIIKFNTPAEVINKTIILN